MCIYLLFHCDGTFTLSGGNISHKHTFSENVILKSIPCNSVESTNLAVHWQQENNANL